MAKTSKNTKGAKVAKPLPSVRLRGIIAELDNFYNDYNCLDMPENGGDAEDHEVTHALVSLEDYAVDLEGEGL